jgi:hypothetical protein
MFKNAWRCAPPPAERGAQPKMRRIFLCAQPILQRICFMAKAVNGRLAL